MPCPPFRGRYRLGKRPKKYDRRTLQFARYLPKLPAPPAIIDHASRLCTVDIGMMGNDRYADCTVAAAGHMVQEWSTYADRGTETIPDSEILAAYAKISPQDDGAYMLDALNLWRDSGIGPDKVEAFAEISAGDLVQAKLAIQYFGSVYIGMSLPDINTLGPWLDPDASGRPDNNNGHAVALIAYDDTKGLFKVATWGEIWDMSYGWYQRYADEAYAVLNDLELLQGTGKSPEGFDWTSLKDDLAHVKDPVTPPDPGPPSPGPPVPPAPPDPPTPKPPIWPWIAAGLVAIGVVLYFLLR